MSRKAPNPAAERAAQNQQTIKALLKLEANKLCADCKRNKRAYCSLLILTSPKVC
jgi:stromal membrane-associated protein